MGGTPNSVIRAGTLGLPLALAIIGGQPASFVPLVDLYRRALEYGGHDPATPLAVHSHGYVFDDEDAARAEFLPAYRRDLRHDRAGTRLAADVRCRGRGADRSGGGAVLRHARDGRGQDHPAATR